MTLGTYYMDEPFAEDSLIDSVLVLCKINPQGSFGLSVNLSSNVLAFFSPLWKIFAGHFEFSLTQVLASKKDHEDFHEQGMAGTILEFFQRRNHKHLKHKMCFDPI